MVFNRDCNLIEAWLIFHRATQIICPSNWRWRIHRIGLGPGDCRCGPTRFVLLDSSEHNLFQIQQRLEVPLRCEPVLGSVDDVPLLDAIFRRFQPDIIYHAAAFKHVPLLERNPIAAVRNNAIGTYTLAQTALRHGTPKLILISTDKAVNPHSVMGVSKRLAELAVVS